MAQTATTRRDLLRFGTSAAAYAAGAAIVTGGIALAGEAKGATSGVSPTLRALIAEAERRHARQRSFSERIYKPAAARFRAADDTIPHVEVPGPHGGIWSTRDDMRVANARMWTSTDRPRATQEQRNQIDAMRRLVTEHDKRQATRDRLGNRALLERVCEIDDALSDRTADAIAAVEDFQPATLADLHAKLAYLVPRGWLCDDGAPERMLADVTRLVGGEA